MHKITAALAALALVVSVTLVTPAAAAHATTTSCATRYGYSRIVRNMTASQVAYWMHQPGRMVTAYAYAGQRWQTNQYRTCVRFGFIQVDFHAVRRGLLRVTGKFGFWA
jgi:hypothetical protein